MLSETTTRHYLRAAERRLSILRAADEVVDRDGIGALNMLSVAARAGLSRQLMYRYFDGAHELVDSWLDYRFEPIRQSFVSALQIFGGDPRRIAESQLQTILSLPALDQRLIRSFVGDLAQMHPELAETISVWRRRLIDRWVALVAPDRANDPVLRARIWGLVHVTIGLLDLLDERELSLEEAHRILMDFAMTIGRST